jgi:universal stress protein E
MPYQLPSVKTILCPVDFSEKSLQVIDHAARIAESFGSKIIALNAVDDTLPEYAPYRKSDKDLQTLRKTLGEDSRNRLNLLIAPRIKNVTASQFITAFGKPYDVIVRVSKEQQAGMVLMATRSMGLMNQFILGSTTYKIVRTAPCPLIVFSKPDIKFRALRILFPTDFSELSLLSIPFVYKFAQDYGADLHIVHFRQLHSSSAAKDPNRDMESVKRHAAANGNIQPNRIMTNSDLKGTTPGSAILKYAKENSIDLTILSAHGNSGYKQFFLGTTAVEVASRSENPVLVVRKTDWSIASA